MSYSHKWTCHFSHGSSHLINLSPSFSPVAPHFRLLMLSSWLMNLYLFRLEPLRDDLFRIWLLRNRFRDLIFYASQFRCESVFYTRFKTIDGGKDSISFFSCLSLYKSFVKDGNRNRKQETLYSILFSSPNLFVCKVIRNYYDCLLWESEVRVVMCNVIQKNKWNEGVFF